MPDTPGAHLDEPDFAFPNRMLDKVTETMLGKLSSPASLTSGDVTVNNTD